MPAFTLLQAEARLSELLARVRQGDDVVITDGGEPVARLVPVARPRRPGALKGRIALTPDFFDPLPEDELAAWGEL